MFWEGMACTSYLLGVGRALGEGCGLPLWEGSGLEVESPSLNVQQSSLLALGHGHRSLCPLHSQPAEIKLLPNQELCNKQASKDPRSSVHHISS